MTEFWISAAVGGVGFVASVVGLLFTHDWLLFGAAFAVAAQGVIYVRAEIQLDRRLDRSSSVTPQQRLPLSPSQAKQSLQ